MTSVFTPLRARMRSRLLAGPLCMAVAVSSGAHAADLSFEQAFNSKGEPANLHYQAVFLSRDTKHQLEVWRQDDRRVKRVTDKVIEIYASRSPGDPEYRLSILDRRRRILTQIDRTNMYRIGSFTDWFDLGHGVRHPKGVYRLSMGTKPKSAPAPLRTCTWYDLAQAGQVTHVCWDRRVRLPMLIASSAGVALWRVTALDQRRIPQQVFQVRAKGYIRNDANKDIETD